MSQENLEVVRRAVAALNARDLDGYLACCTPDVELHIPEVIGGIYEGPEGDKALPYRCRGRCP